ncbi:amidohydrolase family protein [Dapis sp. BLCC M172]|uniref:amidohydrolase family protein n=1 Tax=Dapis sp. BLCC M172 TaxID=2975281 RepID=UPI003CF37AAD
MKQLSNSRRNFLKLATASAMATSVVPAIAQKAKSVDLKPNQSGPYDLVIEGGRVIDPETRLDGLLYVGIKGNRIAAISEEPLEGDKTLNAEGYIVAPGFIDLHAHGQTPTGAWMQAFDGVTTALELESGLLPIGQFYAETEREGRPINFGAAAAWTYARAAAFHGLDPRPNLGFFQESFSYTEWQNNLATPEQLEKILDMVESGLKEGSIGIGINAGYVPAYGRKEYYALAELAAKYNVPTFTHVRYASVIEPNSSFEAMGELIGLSAITGAHMHICHLNSSGGRDALAIVDLIKQAQTQGLPVTTEAYPYGAASTAIGAALFQGEGWEARWGGDIRFELEGKELSSAEVEQLQESEPGTVIVFHFLDPDQSAEDLQNMDAAVLFPGGAIASDGVPWTNATGQFITEDIWPLPDDAFSHPRAAGAYARFISKYVRERRVISLMKALAKTSLFPAQILEKSVPQMLKKGRLQVGGDADIVVFDLGTIQDRATFVEPVQTSAGFRHVIVNGVPIIENEQRIGTARPGRSVRRPTT